MAIDRAWVREYWPFLLGAAIIVVGNVYLYVLGSEDWVPGGPPFLLAIAVVIVIEICRSLYRRYGSSPPT